VVWFGGERAWIQVMAPCYWLVVVLVLGIMFSNAEIPKWRGIGYPPRKQIKYINHTAAPHSHSDSDSHSQH
jgi:hypothetical protein